jgi:HAD superfamily hydrolase (TIGR01509 family)
MNAKKKFWVFDMDGTLTDAKHDFPAIKRQLGLPLDLDILTGLNLLDTKIRDEKHLELNQIEMEIARKATAAPGVFDLLTALKEGDVSLGILTRNNDDNTMATLETTNLIQFFKEEDILTRDSAKPKPHPDGLLKLQSKWGGLSTEMVMIGDYLYDLLVGKAVGVDTIYIDPTGEFKYKEHATYSITQMDHILDFNLF